MLQVITRKLRFDDSYNHEKACNATPLAPETIDSLLANGRPQKSWF
jgi:hypothetical protein